MRNVPDQHKSWSGMRAWTLRNWRKGLKTLPMAQRTQGLSSGYQSKFFRSYHKFSNKSRSDFIFILPTKQQLQNLNLISAFRLNLNFKVLTKPSFRISTKNNLHNLSQGSAAKYWLNFSLKIVPEPQLQSWPNLVLKVWTKNWFSVETPAS